MLSLQKIRNLPCFWLLSGVLVVACDAQASGPGISNGKSAFELGQVARETPIVDFVIEGGPAKTDIQLIRNWCAWLPGLLDHARPGARLGQCGASPASDQAPKAAHSFKLSLPARQRQATLALTESSLAQSLPLEGIQWTYADQVFQSDAGARIAIQRSLNHFFEFEGRAPFFKELILSRGSLDSKSVRLDAQGEYRDMRSDRILTTDAAFELYLRESRRNRSTAKALIQIAAVLGSGAIWYYWDKEFNSQDWEFTLDSRGLRKKIHEGIRMDTNVLFTNSPLHPLAGSFYFAFSRGNGFNALESLLFSFAGSTIWELVVEYREVFSINDMILTPLAGAAIGEVFHQLRLLVERSRGNAFHKFLLAIFGGPSAIDHWWSRRAAPRAKSFDALGFPAEVFRESSVFLGGGSYKRLQSGALPDVGGGVLDLRLLHEAVTLPGYAREGRADRWHWDTVATRVLLDAGVSSEGLESVQAYIHAAWAGYHHQRLRGGEGAPLSGYSFLISPSTSYTHEARRLADGSWDQIGAVNVLGTSMELLCFTGGLKVRLRLEVSGDFAAVHSLAVETYRKQADVREFTKSVLEFEDYYYAFGVTARAGVRAEWDVIEFGVQHASSLYSSIEGLDRYQSRVQDDFPLEDEAHLTRAWLSARLPDERFRILIWLENRMRTGRIDSKVSGRHEASAHDIEVGFGLEYRH